MGIPKNKENIGNFWKDKISLNEDQLIEWINDIKNNIYYPFYNKNKIFSSKDKILGITKKLDEESRIRFKYLWYKEVIGGFICKECSCVIEFEFFKERELNNNKVINLCKECCNNKAYLLKSYGSNNNRYSKKANLKRDNSLSKFWNSKRGEDLKKHTGDFNKINTKKWKSLLTQSQKDKINLKSSISQLKNIKEGKFDPQKNYHHFRKNICYINDKDYNFRSSWEILFFISNPNLEYETLRINYIKETGKGGIYIPDFIDKINKIIYELKPKRNYIKQQLKMDACIKWCYSNNYKFIWINEYNILNYINENDNKDDRNKIWYEKAYKGINENYQNQINSKTRLQRKSI